MTAKLVRSVRLGYEVPSGEPMAGMSMRIRTEDVSS